MRSSYRHFFLMLSGSLVCPLLPYFLFWFALVDFPSGSSCFMLYTSVLNLWCMVTITNMKRIVICIQSSIFFCMCLISIPLCKFESLNPALFSHNYLNLSLCMLNVHYYLAVAILLLFKLIMPCS